MNFFRLRKYFTIFAIMSEWLKLNIFTWMMLIAIRHSSKVFLALFLKYIEDGGLYLGQGGGGRRGHCGML